MKAFKFTLQSPLNVKITLEKQHMAELASCEARIRMFREELEGLHQHLTSEREKYKQEVLEGVKPADLQIWATGFRAINETIEKQKEKIEVAEDEKKRIQKRLLQVINERKTFEKLKEKQFEEYKLKVKAEDAAAIDDFLSNKITRAD